MRTAEADTIAELRREIATLRREVATLRQAKGAGRSDAEVEAEAGGGPSLSRGDLWRELQKQHACIEALTEALAVAEAR